MPAGSWNKEKKWTRRKEERLLNGFLPVKRPPDFLLRLVGVSSVHSIIIQELSTQQSLLIEWLAFGDWTRKECEMVFYQRKRLVCIA